LRLNIFKAKSEQKLTDSISPSVPYEKLEPRKPTELLHQEKLGETIPIEFDEIAPKFLTISKLDFSGTEIHSGIIKDPTSIGGIRYVVIQPRLSIQDKKNFDIIKKLLMTELSISLTEIKSKKDAEKRLRKKIAQLIKNFFMISKFFLS